MDFLHPPSGFSSFDMCIDKGTFDAISLNPEDGQQGKAQYVASLRQVLRPQGLFVITSCNWTKEQLLQIFSPGNEAKAGVPGALRQGTAHLP